MQVFFGTVVRGAPVSKSGELVRLDWKSKRIVGKIPMYPTNPFTEDDPNARGGTRGCRGITFTGRELVVANYHTLHGYSLDLQKNWEISNGLIANVHELFYSGNGKIWVTSTDIDAVLEYSLETGKLTNEFWPRDTAEFRKTFNLTPGRIDKNADNRLKYRDIPYSKDPSHLHPNALAVWQGQYFALFHSLGVIVNLSKSEVIIEDPSLKGGHNLVILEDGTAIVNSSSDRAIRFYD